MALRKKVPVPRKTKLNLSKQRNFTEFVICWSWPKLSNWKPQINQTTTVYTMEYGAIMPNIHPSFHIYLQSWFTLHLSLSIVNMHLNRDTSWHITVVSLGPVLSPSRRSLSAKGKSWSTALWPYRATVSAFLLDVEGVGLVMETSNIPIDLRLSGGIEKYKWILFAPWVQTLSCLL